MKSAEPASRGNLGDASRNLRAFPFAVASCSVPHSNRSPEAMNRTSSILILGWSIAGFIGCAAGVRCASQPSEFADVTLFVEVLDYQVGADRTWGEGPDGKQFEWRNDIFQFRVIEPQEHSGKEWTILLPTALDDEHLARIPRQGARLWIRVDSDALRQLRELSQSSSQYKAWPVQHSKYVFQDKKAGGEQGSRPNGE
jgi:hypothetical protein